MSERAGVDMPRRETGSVETDPVMEAIRRALGGIRFGTVSLTIHEGRVVQLDVTEKRRL
jgi:hypothetical protein